MEHRARYRHTLESQTYRESKFIFLSMSRSYFHHVNKSYFCSIGLQFQSVSAPGAVFYSDTNVNLRGCLFWVSEWNTAPDTDTLWNWTPIGAVVFVDLSEWNTAQIYISVRIKHRARYRHTLELDTYRGSRLC